MTSENALGIKHRTTWQICHYQQSTVLTKTESESTRSAAARLMVKKCANSSCETVFRYFRGGKIFVVEAARVGEAASSRGPQTQFLSSGTSLQYFWLCERCARQMTVISRGDGDSVSVVPRSDMGRYRGIPDQ